MAPGDVTIRVDVDELRALLTMIIERLGDMATQADIDVLAQKLSDMGDRLNTGLSALNVATGGLNAALADIRQDITDIKAGASVDSTALETNLNRVSDLIGQVGVTTGQLTTAASDATELAAENPAAP